MTDAGVPIRLRLTKRKVSYGGGWRFWVEYLSGAQTWVSAEQGNRPLMGWAFRAGQRRLGEHMAATIGCVWRLQRTEVDAQ